MHEQQESAIGAQFELPIVPAAPQDPETALRAMWTARGIPQARQNAIIAIITAAAQPGAMCGPFVIGAKRG